MKRKDIYVGVLKKCIDKNNYEKHGDSFYEDDFRLRTIRFGSLRHNAINFSEQAVLIKVGEGKYIWLKSINSIIDEIKLDLGIKINILYTYPKKDGDIFVDKESLVPYYENHNNKKIRVRKLRKEVSFDSANLGNIEN